MVYCSIRVLSMSLEDVQKYSKHSHPFVEIGGSDSLESVAISSYVRKGIVLAELACHSWDTKDICAGSLNLGWASVSKTMGLAWHQSHVATNLGYKYKYRMSIESKYFNLYFILEPKYCSTKLSILVMISGSW